MKRATYRKLDSQILLDDSYGIEGKYLVSIQTEGAALLDSFHKPTLAGEIISKLWKSIPDHFENVEANQFVLSKDTFYGILNIDLSGKKVGQKEYHFRVVSQFEITFGMMICRKNPFLIEGSIFHVISWLKASSLIEIVKSANPDFRWKSGYFDFSIEKDAHEEELLQMIKETI